MIRKENGYIVVSGLVNVHTHTQWNTVPSMARGDGMAPWLSRVIEHGGAVQGQESVDFTAVRFQEFGIGAVGDFGSETSVVLSDVFPGRHYWEILREDGGFVNETRDSFGPHAVHTVFETALIELSKLGQSKEIHIAIHAGESPEEKMLFESGSGTLAEILESRNFPDGHVSRLVGSSPMKVLQELGLLNRRTLVVHAIHLSDSDLDLIAEAKASIALCPMSNQEMGVGFTSEIESGKRVRAMFDRGINIAIGTDSTLSSSEISMTANARILGQVGVTTNEIQTMLWNREAIGLECESTGEFYLKDDGSDPMEQILAATTFLQQPF